MIAQAFNTKTSEAFKYIFENMPKENAPKNIFAAKAIWQPSDQELSAFEQKISVVLDPMSVLQELESGTITKHHVSALKKVYPLMHEQLKSRITNEAVKGLKPLNYAGRIKLSLLFDEPLDRSLTPKSILDYQKTYAMPDPSIDPTDAGKLKVAQDSASDVTRLMS